MLHSQWLRVGFYAVDRFQKDVLPFLTTSCGGAGCHVIDNGSTCQIAALQPWLNEPLVTQMHRADDASPRTAYPTPPFN